MTRAAALVLATVCSLQAAVIRGVVLDHETGRPLARTVLTLQSIQGYGSGERTARAASSGQFLFSPVPAGLYLLRAARPGFAPFQYGQKDWNAPGTPITVQENDAPYLEMRLRRLGAISGVVWDENEVGIPDQEVVAYTAAHPPAIAARAKTDDRGAFRIHGLIPGSYYVRSAPKRLEDGSGLLPTFYPDTSPSVDQGRTVDVYLEQQATDVNIKPAPGRLVRLSGTAYVYPFVPMTVTLVSDMGRQSTGTDGQGRFSFEEVAPGPYEVYAVTNGESSSASSAYDHLTLERDQNIRLQVHRNGEMRLAFEDREGGKVDPGAFTVLARRTDLAGPGTAIRLALTTTMPDGRWEVAVIPPPYFYAAAIAGCSRAGNEAGRADGWNEVRIQGGGACELKVSLSAHPAAVHGRVTASGSDPAPGAPVFLEPFDGDTGKRAGDLRAARTDPHGAYQFPGLAPGKYRLLSTFDYDNPEEPAFQGATVVTLTEGRDLVQNLNLR